MQGENGKSVLRKLGQSMFSLFFQRPENQSSKPQMIATDEVILSCEALESLEDSQDLWD